MFRVDGEDLDFAGLMRHDEARPTGEARSSSKGFTEDLPAANDRDLIRFVPRGGATLKQVIGRTTGVGKSAKHISQHAGVIVDTLDQRALIDADYTVTNVGIDSLDGQGALAGRVSQKKRPGATSTEPLLFCAAGSPAGGFADPPDNDRQAPCRAANTGVVVR